jgi:hypothetical protein
MHYHARLQAGAVEEEVLILSTAKPPAAIIAQGGSQSWILDPLRMRHVRYAICTVRPSRVAGGQLPKPGQAFLVGKISGLRPVMIEDTRPRYFVQFSAYAAVAIDDFCSSARIGPRYAGITKVQELGIDLAALRFMPIG